MIRNSLVFTILAHNLQKMGPSVDSNDDIFKSSRLPKSLGMDDIAGRLDAFVPGDINIGNFDNE